ncbi:LacI family DNA-binding transcriptional regulator [Vibrio sonorensis]|uniref:LacI family DNA-binding transcriptional regulator n=1 Tax=Vibrio sonorensis TaxID=1004316 RepID=UPI0008D99DED|nr:LacI family DNA-binding transcriptional regulator [Vibrio sonorensis]
MATINDVCRVAGVSKATVSRVINGTGQVKASTREHVESVMEALNYRPNSLAKALATNSSNSIGLVLSDFSGSYFGGLMKQASISAESRSKQLLIADGHNDAQREIEAIESLVDKRCDVIVLYSRMLTTEQLTEIKQKHGVPIVCVGRELPSEAGNSVGFNQFQAGYLAAKHLVDLGHKKLIYVGPKPITPSAERRLAGFHQLVSEHGYSELVLTMESNFGFEDGYQLATRNLPTITDYTGIVCASDDIAIGFLKAFNDHRISVPKEISVIGIDNDPLSQFVSPSLTSIDVPIKQITEAALLMACSLMEGKKLEKSNLVFDAHIIERDSTRPLL